LGTPWRRLEHAAEIAYDAAQPIPADLHQSPTTFSTNFRAAQIAHGCAARNAKMIPVDLCSFVDDLGVVPIFGPNPEWRS
jgi:hypothetical protein